MRGVTGRHTNQYDLGWWKELAFRLGRECGCGLDSVRDRRTDDDAPNASEYPLTLAMMGTNDIAAPLLAWNVSLQRISGPLSSTRGSQIRGSKRIKYTIRNVQTVAQ